MDDRIDIRAISDVQFAADGLGEEFFRQATSELVLAPDNVAAELGECVEGISAR